MDLEIRKSYTFIHWLITCPYVVKCETCNIIFSTNFTFALVKTKMFIQQGLFQFAVNYVIIHFERTITIMINIVSEIINIYYIYNKQFQIPDLKNKTLCQRK